MKLKNILIVVDNIEESIHFYNELFGLNVISRQEGNVIMSEGPGIAGCRNMEGKHADTDYSI